MDTIGDLPRMEPHAKQIKDRHTLVYFNSVYLLSRQGGCTKACWAITKVSKLPGVINGHGSRVLDHVYTSWRCTSCIRLDTHA